MPDNAAHAEMDSLDEYERIISTLPTRAPIFLPTERLNPAARLEGVRRVKSLYEDELARVHTPRLKALKEKHQGAQRCFIIGNGPSLNQTDLDVLENETTFAVNGFFLKSRKMSWTPTYYLVEDHLVAEDRHHWINNFKGPTKLFPAYLAYCIDNADDVIFFNHRPRKSYPDGFDFSLEADKITYTGCTVTFTAMQLAAYMGFQEIYLIGVDADYAIPADAQKGGAYATGVLDMQSADPNHFDPSYFGRGHRWHDPQVDKMIQAYEEAERVVTANGQRIFNAGVGGKLEIFERKPFDEVVPGARIPAVVALENDRAEFRALPANSEAAWEGAEGVRVLSFDLTQFGDGTATGELKRELYKGFPTSQLVQVFKDTHALVSLGPGGVRNAVKTDAEWDAIFDAFAPTVIVYRPVPDQPELHALAMKQINRYSAGLVLWVMDDWPAVLEAREDAGSKALLSDFSDLVIKADRCLSISDQMSEAFARRYGVPFLPVANGVDPAAWPKPHIRPPGEFVFRYGGGLAENMTLDSVVRFAKAVDALAKRGLGVSLEIRTRQLWLERSGDPFSKLGAVTTHTNSLSKEEYSEWLSEADALLIAYNFDDESLRYTRHSLANKMPECLASGTPVFAHGPLEQATIRFLKQYEAAQICASFDCAALEDAIAQLVENPFRQLDLAERGQAVAFLRRHIDDARADFKAALSTASMSDTGASAPVAGAQDAEAQFRKRFEFTRNDSVSINENQVIAELFKNRRGPQNVMIDVGAHYGTSANYLDKLNWTIHCFEPDPANRRTLVSKFGAADNVIIDPRALNEKPACGLEFFTSEESTGISSLHAFRPTHKVAFKVDATTIKDVVLSREIQNINFLKTDVEGLDFAVLKGVPWNKVKPDVIVSEFEDAMTKSLGHDYSDVCDYLVQRGYTVYLSEWHPIIRYGIPHDWRRVVRYPDVKPKTEAWGNILAFQQDPGLPTLQSAFERCLKRRQ